MFSNKLYHHVWTVHGSADNLRPLTGSNSVCSREVMSSCSGARDATGHDQ